MAAAQSSLTIIKKKSKVPDPILVKDQLVLLQSMHKDWGLPNFAKYFIWILAKTEDKRIASKRKVASRYVPFSFNDIQLDISRNATKKNICCKPRQVGLTTWFLLIRLLVPTIINPGTNGYLISQKSEMATKHFRMLKRALKYFGAENPASMASNDLCLSLHENLLHTQASNTKEVIFSQLDNFIGIGSAEVEEVGQGLTLHRVVCSELARWPGKPEETIANIKESVVIDGTFDAESTANGAQGYFFEEFMRAWEGRSDFKAHFHPWWWDRSYRIQLTEKQEKELAKDLEADEIRLKEAMKLELSQIAFRREKKLALRHNFDEKYPEDPITCFLLSGKGYFDKDILRARFLELQSFKPYGKTSGGVCIILKKWIKGRQYICGADPASGKSITTDDSDFSCAKVIDLETGEECAIYRARIAPQDFALDLAELGRAYNNALMAVERGTAADAGGDGGTVLLTLIHDCRYTNIYKHKEWLKRDKRSGKGRSIIELEGMPMNGKTRPIALNRLKFFIENEPDKIWDLSLIKECLQFIRDERGRPAGAEGQHDDDVMASAIAHYARNVIQGYLSPEVAKAEKYGATPREFAEAEELDEDDE